MRIPLLVATAVLAAGCASSPKVVESSPTMVTITGDALSRNTDEAIFALAAEECRKHGRRAIAARSDSVRFYPRWEFHCVR